MRVHAAATTGRGDRRVPPIRPLLEGESLVGFVAVVIIAVVIVPVVIVALLLAIASAPFGLALGLPPELAADQHGDTATGDVCRATTQSARNGQYQHHPMSHRLPNRHTSRLLRVRTGNPALDTDTPWRYALPEQRPRLRGASL